VAEAFKRCLTDMVQVHLLANTPNETTVYGVFAGVGDEA
jgi:hypothetical protein